MDAGQQLLAAIEALNANINGLRDEIRSDRADRESLASLRKAAAGRKAKERERLKSQSRDSHATQEAEAEVVVTGQSRDMSRDSHVTPQVVKAVAVVGDLEPTTRTKILQRPVTVTRQPVTRQAAATRTGPVWAAYSTAIQDRYGEQPTRNAKTNGQLAQLVIRLGDDAAPVAAFYVQHSAAWYATKGHQIGPLLADAEKLHLEWRTGRQINATDARIQERSDANVNGWSKHLSTAKGGS